MSMNKSRKSKPNRSTKSKPPGQQNHPFTGAYENRRLVHVLLSLMGKKCQAKVRCGGTYEGVFHTFNPAMDVSMDAVHKCDTSDNPSASTNGDVRLSDCPKEEQLIEQMIFRSDKMVSVSFEDVDLSFAELEINESNGETAAPVRPPTKGGEKKLEPWNGGGDSIEEEGIGGLEDGLSPGVNGWGAEQMFRANEEKYGVKSDYDSSLSNYTMALDLKDTEEDSERVARATRMAQEIEGQSEYKQRIELELDDGVTEEDKFSAVTRDRDTRRDGRDSRDMRERDHREYRDRDKDRGDRERDPLSPQGFRSKHEYDRFHQPNRNRGRGRDWDKRNQGYAGMGPSRSVGPGGPPSIPGRNQPPVSQMDAAPNQSGMKYRPPSSQALPPRLQRSGSGGHSGSAQRDDDRMRQHGENNSMHHGYGQAPKNQRQPRAIRTNQGQRGWITSPPGPEYTHHSPTAQMHQDPAVISVTPGGSGGPPTLSRTSSSSSSTSAPPQGVNHRKHLSTSSQEDQQHPSPHHQHPRQQVPTSAQGPPPNSNQVPQGMARPQGMASNPQTLPGKDTSWSSIVSRNPPGPKPMMGPGPGSEMAQAHVHQGPPQQAPIPHHSPGSRIPPHVVNVRQNAKYTYTPRGGTPPTSNVPTPYPGAPQTMNPQMSGNMTSPRLHQHAHNMPPMGEHGVSHIPGQMMTRPPPPQQAMVSSPPQQQMQPPQMHAMATQPSPRNPKMPPGANLPAPNSEPARHKPEKAEDEGKQNAKKSLEPPPSQTTSSGVVKNRNGSPSFTELKKFGQNFKLLSDVKSKDPQQAVAQPQQVNKAPPRQPISVPHTTQSLARGPPLSGPGPQQQPYHQVPQPSYAVTVARAEPGPQHVSMQTGVQMAAGVVPQPKPGQQQQPPPVMNQMHHQHQQAAYQQIQQHHQIPMPGPNIQHFGSMPPVPPSQPMQTLVKSPRAPDGVQQPVGRSMPQGEKMAPSPQPMKPMTSPKQDMPMPNIQHGNVHIATAHQQHTTASAVITVSAVPGSPIIPSHYTATAPMMLRNSPTGPPVLAHASSPAEAKPMSQPTMPATSTPSATSPTAGVKALNPEAQEFKPRTPAKPQIAARATTPQMPVYMPVTQMGPQPGQMATPVYNTGQQQVSIDQHMQASLQQHMVGGQQLYHHPQFQQQFILQPAQPAQHVVQQMQGQQMQQYTFDQSPVYASPTGQPTMMPQNARVAIPGNQQGHMQPYQPDQTGPMYVPIAQGGGMQANFMQQTRPHSAHTPTQASHVTAASPANASGQQAQPPTGHQGMVQQGAAVTQMWMPIPGNNANFMMVAPNQHLQPATGMPVNQNPQPPQTYLNPMRAPIPSSVPITGVTAQQKGQPQAIAAAQYITHQAQGQYPPYQAAPANQ